MLEGLSRRCLEVVDKIQQLEFASGHRDMNSNVIPVLSARWIYHSPDFVLADEDLQLSLATVS